MTQPAQSELHVAGSGAGVDQPKLCHQFHEGPNGGTFVVIITPNSHGTPKPISKISVESIDLNNALDWFKASTL